MNPAAGSHWNNITPLHLAAEAGHFNVIKYLAPKVPDVDVKDSNGNTPRQIANQKRRSDIEEFLDQLANDS